MKKIICILLLFIIIPIHAYCFSFDESDIPEPIKDELISLEAETSNSFYALTGIRFDLDDENMPIIIVKEKQKNKSNRSISKNNDLWIFSYDPYSSGGPKLKPANSHYKKEYLGVTVTKDKKGKIKVRRNDKTELAPNEEYEWETPYQIDNFSDPVYMYFMTSENSINEKWRYETIVVIPETGSVNFLEGKK